MDIALHQLIKACTDFDNPSKRQEAEKELLAFRRSENVIPVCRYALEKIHDNSMVLFQVASAIKEGIIRGYTLQSKVDISLLQTQIMNYLLEHPALELFVKQQLLQALAIIIKRGWLDYSQEERQQILSSIPQLLQSQGNGRHLAILFAIALMNEFSSRRSSAIGLTLEFHLRSRSAFESYGLREIFEATLATLQDIIRKETFQIADKHVFISCIAAVDMVLSWDFVIKSSNLSSSLKLNYGATSENGSPDRFPKEWSTLLVSADFLDLFIMLFNLVLSNEDLAHRVAQSLIMLSGLQGPIFPSEAAKSQYSCHLLKHIFALLKRVEDSALRLFVCQMLKRLIDTFRTSLLCDSEFPNCLMLAATMTGSSITNAVKDDVDETWNMETFDVLLEAWVSLHQIVSNAVESNNSHTIPNIESYIKLIGDVGYHTVEAYAQARIDFANESLEEELIMDMKDQEVFDDQLISLATVGRLHGLQSVSLLTQLLRERLSLLQTAFAHLHEGKIGDDYIHSIHDHIHWLLLISGYIVADTGDGEKPMIPRSFLSESSGEHPLSQLMTCVMEIMNLFTAASQTPQRVYLSPLVVETLFWFSERFAKSYLFADGTNDVQLTDGLAEEFGAKSPQTHQKIEFFLDQAQANLMLWCGEGEIISAIIKLLNAFTSDKTMQKYLMSTAKWPALVGFLLHRLSVLPGSTHSPLIAALVRAGSGTVTEAQKNQYYASIFTTVEKQYLELTARHDFTEHKEDATTLVHLQNVLDIFVGLATALDPTSNQDFIFPFFVCYFDRFAKLVDVYHSAPEIVNGVLEIWEKLIEHLGVYKLKEDERHLLFRSCLHVLKIFSAVSTGRKQRIHEDENIICDDVHIILKLLSNFMAGDFAGYFDDGKAPNSGESPAIEVVLFGLNLLIPMITKSMMEMPNITSEYMKLINNIMECYPERLLYLSPPLFTSLIESILYGMEHPSYEISRLGFDAVASLAEQHVHDRVQHGPQAELMGKSLDLVLRQVLEIVFFKDYDGDLIEASIGRTLLLLMQARHEIVPTYLEHIVQHALQSVGSNAGSPLDKHLRHVIGEFWNTVRPIVASPSIAQALRKKKEKELFEQKLMELLMTVRGLKIK